jgi:hypothetical protein
MLEVKELITRQKYYQELKKEMRRLGKTVPSELSSSTFSEKEKQLKDQKE